MRRLVMILTFLCPLTMGLLQAQSSLYIGARAGLSASKFKFTEDLKELYPTASRTLGVAGGVDMGLNLGNWTISSGIHYVQKGSKFETDNFFEGGTEAVYTGHEKVHFITVPVLLGYQEHLSDRVGWSLAMGPAFNFGLTGKLDEEVSYFGTDEVDIQNHKVTFGDGVNDDYKGSQVSFQLTPGLFYKVNKNSTLTFNVAWDFGIGDMYNKRYKQANDFFDDYKGNQSSRTTMFTIGYQYHFNFEDKY